MIAGLVVGTRRHRDVARGGVIGFWPALGVGVGISFVAGIFYVVAWELVQAMSSMDFASACSSAILAK